MARLYDCAACGQSLAASNYSKGQLKKAAARRCQSCISAPPQLAAAEATGAPEVKYLVAHELAAQVVHLVNRGGVGVRSALYDPSLRVPNKLRPVVTALVSEVLRSLPALQTALAAVDGPWSTTDDRASRMLVRGQFFCA